MRSALPQGGLVRFSVWSVTSDLATIDVHDFPGDKGRRLEKQNALDDVAHLAHVAEGLAIAQAFVFDGIVDGRSDDAW